jgi:hypothetical protein
MPERSDPVVTGLAFHVVGAVLAFAAMTVQVAILASATPDRPQEVTWGSVAAFAFAWMALFVAASSVVVDRIARSSIISSRAVVWPIVTALGCLGAGPGLYAASARLGSLASIWPLASVGFALWAAYTGALLRRVARFGADAPQ